MPKGSYYYIYKITNVANNKVYIGKRTSIQPPAEDTEYLGSGKLIRRAVLKYGKDKFKKEILEECTKDNINEREKYYIKKENSCDIALGYNILEGGDGTDGVCGTMCTYYNKDTDEEIRIPVGTEVQEGFIKGRRPFSKSLIEKMAHKGCTNGMYGVRRYGSTNPFHGKTHSVETMVRLGIVRGYKRVVHNNGVEYIIGACDSVPEGFIPFENYSDSKIFQELERVRKLCKKHRDIKNRIMTYIRRVNARGVDYTLDISEYFLSLGLMTAINEDIKNVVAGGTQAILQQHLVNIDRPKASIDLSLVDISKECTRKRSSRKKSPVHPDKLKEKQRHARIEYWEEHPEKLVCPHCGKTGRGAGFYKWHDENCVHHPQRGEENKIVHAEWFAQVSKRNQGKAGTTTGKVCITNGEQNKFVNPEDLGKYPNWHKGMTKG
nr:MAG TPA: intron associated endonuclease [Caudoviricetes sp.]